jgi:hypothetical protein
MYSYRYEKRVKYYGHTTSAERSGKTYLTKNKKCKDIYEKKTTFFLPSALEKILIIFNFEKKIICTRDIVSSR